MTTLETFLSRLEPMQRAKAKAALEMQVRVNDKDFMLRHQLVESRVATGAVLVDTKHSGLVLQDPEGAFLDQRNITKTGLHYAAFLTC
jgi:hypothetical protein